MILSKVFMLSGWDKLWHLIKASW